ncbi:hypothetical protein [Peribacillus frigoritolerans]|uniref:hypothetical protein n=1 Tax=Peribacillus frigoritolerans TaxID=450367 RepID=UPI0025A1DF81|nr:hypothetical protein [Peribacillus frigoritolerans]MDM5313371.1 hypothetical protein [Peribacillus frigoritolerans]
MDTEKLIAEYLESNSPSTALDHALAFAYLKVTGQVTQKQYAEAVGISDRALRKYISDNKEDYDEEIARIEAEVDKPLDLSSLSSRTLTEEQLDKFVDVLYKSAITGNARDKQLFIEFTGLTAEDVMNLQTAKQKSLRWIIKGELGSISKYFDSKQLGIMIEESPYLFRGDKQSTGNPNNFVQGDITDEAFVREMAYFGMLFCSMYNHTAHPDTEVVSKAVRLDRLEQGIRQAFNRQEVQKYIEGKNIKPDPPAKPMTDDEYRQMLIDLASLDGRPDLEEIEREVESRREARKVTKEVVKPAEIKPDVIEKRATQHKDALEVFTGYEKDLKSLLRMLDGLGKN